MNIAIIGSGAREHAIAWHLSQYHKSNKIYIFSQHNILPNSVQFDITDFKLVDHFCTKLNIELLIVGPEEHLANGIVDFFHDSRIKVFGPNKRAAQLESSKIWAKNFMRKYKVATADFNAFDNISQVRAYLQNIDERQFVIKYDGLAAGKGVFVCKDIADGEKALTTLSQKYGNDIRILVENRLFGKELSLIAISGKNQKGLPAIQLLATAMDYKRAHDGDQGPNTGGMGVICPHPSWSKSLEKKIYQDIINPTLEGLKCENLNFYGFLYFGIIITKTGPQLLEYNARFGDPEAQVILPAMQEDISSIILQALENNLTDKSCILKKQVFIDVALVSQGYPDTYETNKLITGIEKLDKETLLFYSAVNEKDNQKYSSGGRVLHIVAHANTIDQARDKVYKECGKIHFSNIYYRKDIGKNVND